MRVRLVFIVIVFVLSLANCAQSSETSIERRIQNVEDGLLSAYGDPPWERMEIAERMAYYNVPGASITVINDYQIEWARGYGVLEAGGSEQVTPETLFQVASVAKPVVAVAALYYVERGLVDLDSDVNSSLVSWQVPENEFTAEEKVTLRRLLSHNAGMTVEGFRGYALGEQVPNPQQILNGEWPANSPSIRVDIVPGTQHRYSGGGYMIVQQLLEDVTGEPFPDIIQNSVLEPWGMTASTLESPLPERLRAIAASGHRADGSPIPGGWHTYPEMGSGASMWSTSSDLAQFGIGVMLSYAGESGGVLSHAMAIQMLTPQIDDRGLGPVLGDDGGDLFFFMHPGANDGYKSVLVVYPQRGQGVVILTNGDNGDALWREILNSVSIEYGWVGKIIAEKNVAWVWLLLTVGSLIVLIWDSVRGTPVPWGGRLVWTCITAIFGPLGLMAYLLSYRQPMRSAKPQATVTNWQRALAATSYSVAGYAIVWLLGIVYFAYFLPNPEPMHILVVTYIAPLIIGLLAFRPLLVVSRLGERYWVALRRTALTELISVHLAFAGMFPVILFLVERWFPGPPDLRNPLVWFMISLAAIAAALVVYPFNAWMARRRLDCLPVWLLAGEATVEEDNIVLPSLRNAWAALLLSFALFIVSLGLTASNLS
ncbi:MAG: serine hydrolase [Chloroflexota bacterium]|nr:serine hydrolase [Chloroflexota bacterium]